MSERYSAYWEEVQDTLGYSFSGRERDIWAPSMRSYDEGGLAWDDLISTIRNNLIAYGRIPDAREPTEPMEPASSGMGKTKRRRQERGLTRAQLLTDIIAAHAAEAPDVRQFRDEVLQGQVMSWSAVQDWITQQREQERAQDLPRLCLTVPLPPNFRYHISAQGGFVADPPLCIDEKHPALSLQRETLDYATPDNRWVQTIPIAYGGPLARLKELSTTLAQRYQWQPALATVFILTGQIPVLQPVKMSALWSEFQTDKGPVTALGRIVLTIDPTLTPKEVSIAYQGIRKRILQPKWRDLGDWQLALARFIFDREDTETWQERFTMWNKTVTEEKWRYDTVSNFKRACENAVEKLLTPILAERFFHHPEDSHAETPRES